MRAHLERGRASLATFAARVDALSPLAVLARGYAIVRLGEQGPILHSPAQVAPGDPLSIRLAEGELGATAGLPGTPADGEKP